jgi:hypothetical protein
MHSASRLEVRLSSSAFASDVGGTWSLVLATWFRPRLAISFAPTGRKRALATLQGEGACDPQGRAQGRPGARCTRGLVCIDAHRNAHTSIQVQRKHSGLPCAMALRPIRALPGDRLVCHRRPREALTSQELDASSGAPGPHDFAVRTDVARLATPTRPPQPAPTSVTWPTSPLAGQDAL